MVVYLCRWCHMYLHEHPGKAKMLKLKAQLVWESVYGDREAFIKRYGKNYGRWRRPEIGEPCESSSYRFSS